MKVMVPTRLTILAAVGAAALIAAEAPYAGKWKLNPAKSDFGETTVTYEQLAGGEMKATADGQAYTFKPDDGKEYPTPWGGTVSWKTIDTHTWQTTINANGKVTSTETLKLSTDGKTLTVDSKNIKANGDSSKDAAVFERLSGGPGLAGKWKTKNVKISSPGVLEVALNGSDGLTLSFLDEKATCAARFDGKDYPATGPIWPPGWTCVVAKDSARSFDVTWKKDGKPMFKGKFSASADGKILTEDGS